MILMMRNQDPILLLLDRKSQAESGNHLSSCPLLYLVMNGWLELFLTTWVCHPIPTTSFGHGTTNLTRPHFSTPTILRREWCFLLFHWLVKIDLSCRNGIIEGNPHMRAAWTLAYSEAIVFSHHHLQTPARTLSPTSTRSNRSWTAELHRDTERERDREREIYWRNKRADNLPWSGVFRYKGSDWGTFCIQRWRFWWHRIRSQARDLKPLAS